MDIVYSEEYRIMQRTLENDLLLCFREDKSEIVAVTLEEAKRLKEEAENDECFDYPLVIVRETQVIVE